MISIPGIIVGTIASAVIAVILFKPFFGDKADFWDCVKYGIKPNFLSWLDKDLQQDYGKSMKLGIYILCLAASGYVAYLAIESLG
jgi:hypothetical protein